MRIARVFPRRTTATPRDELSWSLNRTKYDMPIWETAFPPRIAIPEIDEVHISVSFTYDIPDAEILAKEWEVVGVPVKMGGPAFGNPSGEFVPGLYVKQGITITSRGCPNHCGFCSVWRREPEYKELPILTGNIINDDNLLAGSENHIRSVFDMLKRQPGRPCFNGGLEAKIMKPWHVELLHEVKAHEIFMAYDTPDDYEPLRDAAKMLHEAGFTFEGHTLRAYVLINWMRNDTFEKAEKRLMEVLRLGVWPMAMLYKDEEGHEDPVWRRFQRQWADISKVYSRMKNGEIRL